MPVVLLYVYRLYFDVTHTIVPKFICQRTFMVVKPNRAFSKQKQEMNNVVLLYTTVLKNVQITLQASTI